MTPLDRTASYAALVAARQLCRACTGLINPAACDGGIHDSDAIGPWSLWQGNLNADLVIVGQDWGDTGYFSANKGHEKAGNPTNVTLMKLLASIGIVIAVPTADDAGGGAVFMTNAILCLKDGGMQGDVRPEWFANCGARFLKPTIDVISPKVVVTLEERAYRALVGGYGLPRMAFRTAVERPEGFMLASGTRCWPMYHCGARILNTHQPYERQVRDWQRVGTALEN
ncbi:MAG: uracil-DNA glycosylase family protein [Candidatus Solibacter sp.]